MLSLTVLKARRSKSCVTGLKSRCQHSHTHYRISKRECIIESFRMGLPALLGLKLNLSGPCLSGQISSSSSMCNLPLLIPYRHVITFRPTGIIQISSLPPKFLNLVTSQSLNHLIPLHRFWGLVQFSSVSQSCPTLCDPMDCSTPGFPVHHQLPEFTEIHVHWICDAIQPSHPLSSPSPPAFNLSQYQGLFQWASSSHQVAKVLAFQLQHQSFQWTLRTSFRMDWLDLLAVQGTLKSLLQHDSSKVSIPCHSAFFIVQLSHPYMTTEKTIALTRQTFVGKVMSLLLNMLSSLVITFLPRNKHLLISWLQ